MVERIKKLRGGGCMCVRLFVGSWGGGCCFFIVDMSTLYLLFLASFFFPTGMVWFPVFFFCFSELMTFLGLFLFFSSPLSPSFLL